MSEKFSEEQQMVIQAFEKGLKKKKEEKILLYGVGINTKAILESVSGFAIIGLMDPSTEGQEKYGLSVYSAEDVIGMREKPIIVIVARQSVVPIIYRRIQILHDDYGIEIYDFKGTELGKGETAYANEQLDYWNASEEALKSEIDRHEIITFDIFDTLLMRRVLNPADVFELVENRLFKKKPEGFAKLRISIETELNKQKKYPSIDEIYEEMGRKSSIAPEELEQIKELEIETDRAQIIKRTKVCEIFRYALSRGKKVFLLSDMYYHEEYLKELLSEHGIEGYDDIWVSCDRRAEKEDGSMYHAFIQYIVNKDKILHIGDNRYADFDRAREAGIDAYRIYSAKEMLQASSLQTILSDSGSLQKRCMIGMMIAKAFNDPFHLCASRGWIDVVRAEQIGYFGIGSLLCEFTKWFGELAREKGIDRIIFPSRDGYLIQKIYKLLYGGDAIDSVYVRASRRAVTVACIEDAGDIVRISRRTYQGDCKGLLLSRYGIEMSDTDKRKNISVKCMSEEEISCLLQDYEAAILENAKLERERYWEYFKKMRIRDDQKLLLFDFVAGGTVQYSFDHLIKPRKLLGAYFATMNLPNEMYSLDTKDIVSAYGNIRSYKIDSELGKHYLFMETVLVDDKNTFSHFGANLEEFYEDKTGGSDLEVIKKIQAAAIQYVRDYVELYGDLKPDLKAADELYGIMFSAGCRISNELKKAFVNDDVYDGVGNYGVCD